MSEKRPVVIKDDGRKQELNDGDVLFNIPSLPTVATTDITIPAGRLCILPNTFDLDTFDLNIDGDLATI